MGWLKNSFDFGRALVQDVATSPVRLHRHMSTYFSKNAAEQIEQDRGGFGSLQSLETMQARSEEHLSDARINLGFAHMTVAASQVAAGVFLSNALSQDASSASTLLTIGATMLATNDAVMQVFDKTAQFMNGNSIETGERPYPRTAEVLQRMGSDHDAPPLDL
jgi:hypothetical protein